jgi:hypothetical protein
MTEEGLRGWGIIICVLLAAGLVGTALLQMNHPAWSPWNWVGIGFIGGVLVLMWESVKKIGAK